MPRGFTGHVRLPNKDHLQHLSRLRHRQLHQVLRATPTPPTWDSRTQGWVGPVKNQGQCGSCWDFSGTGVVEIAYYKAGVLPPDGSAVLSEEYTLSCGQNGGCSGDDNVTVLQWAKATGLPASAEYGSYTASADRCNFKAGMKLFKIDDWGFVGPDSSQTVTDTDLIKAAILKYGCVGCAVAAGGSDFWNSGQGVDTGRSGSIDHDVILVGWDDAKGPHGAWIMRNSWGPGWGDGGYAWMAYGADSIGTEAVWALVNGAAPPIDYFV